jgi:hypothetical protein
MSKFSIILFFFFFFFSPSLFSVSFCLLRFLSFSPFFSVFLFLLMVEVIQVAD